MQPLFISGSLKGVDSAVSPALTNAEPTMAELREHLKHLSMEVLELRGDMLPHPRLSWLNLPLFNGTGPITCFINRCNGYSRVQWLIDQQKVNFLFPQLSGRVADWYAITTQEKPLQTWTDAEAMLKELYDEIDMDMENMQMYSCIMEKGEAVNDYFLDKK